MAAVVTNLLYFAISVALVAVVGQALSRSGRAFLAEAMAGGDSAARAVSRLLVMAFYLLSLGFVALTAPSWSHVAARPRARRCCRAGSACCCWCWARCT